MSKPFLGYRRLREGTVDYDPKRERHGRGRRCDLIEHYANGKLIKVERLLWLFPRRVRDLDGTYQTIRYGYYWTIWKRGWRHVKGARKTA